MSKENKTPTRQFVEVGDAHNSGESASEIEENLQSQLIDRRFSSSEVDRRINGIVAPLGTPLETLIQSVKELSERSSNRATEGNAASERPERSERSTFRHELHPLNTKWSI